MGRWSLVVGRWHRALGAAIDSHTRATDHRPEFSRAAATRTAAVLLLALATASCEQDYEFQPLRPVTFRQTVSARKVVAKQFKPNVMLVIDRSQSMSFPISSTGTGQTRIDAVKAAMDTYLKNYGTVART